MFKYLKIKNKNLQIQVNKNYGICGLNLGHFLNGKFVKEELDSRIFSSFQGRQYNDQEVIDNLKFTIKQVLENGEL